MENIFLANGNLRKAGVVIVKSDKLDFRTKNVIRDTKGHYIMIKELIDQKVDIQVPALFHYRKPSPRWQISALATGTWVVVTTFNSYPRVPAGPLLICMAPHC